MDCSFITKAHQLLCWLDVTFSRYNNIDKAVGEPDKSVLNIFRSLTEGYTKISGDRMLDAFLIRTASYCTLHFLLDAILHEGKDGCFLGKKHHGSHASIQI